VLKEDETCPEASTARQNIRERDQDIRPDAASVHQGGGEQDQGARTLTANAGRRIARRGSPEQATLYPCLPGAIAPSLASTPEFARRNSWCHAIEVLYLY
jgi:hypothetical protein